MNGFKYIGESKNIDLFHFKSTFLTQLNINLNSPIEFLDFCFFNMDTILFHSHSYELIKHKQYLIFEETKEMNINFSQTFILKKQYQKMLKYQKYFSCSEDTYIFFKNHIKT